jgi:hypothetical protein
MTELDLRDSGWVGWTDGQRKMTKEKVNEEQTKKTFEWTGKWQTQRRRQTRGLQNERHSFYQASNRTKVKRQSQRIEINGC